MQCACSLAWSQGCAPYFKTLFGWIKSWTYYTMFHQLWDLYVCCTSVRLRRGWDVWSEAIVYDYKTISHNMMTLNSITRFSVVRAWLGFTVTFEHAMTLPRNWMDFSPVWKLQLRQQVQQGSECNRVVMETQGYRSDGNTGFQVEFISSQDKPPPIQEMPSRALT